MNKKTTEEMRIYGENACTAIFKNRPQDIVQLFFTKQKTKETPHLIRDMTVYLAKNKKSYHLVTREEISTMTKATHHEDISMLVKKKKELTLPEFFKLKNEKSLLLILEDVSNPHNIGAILRTAAHFGVSGIIVSSKKVAETASAIRVSEGGFEFVNIFESENLAQTLSDLNKEKYQIITTSSHSKKTLSDFKWKKKAAILFGEEAHGLSKELLASGECLKIPGTDHVESLNVSVATSIMMYDYFLKVN
jgi:TrmH RNA methyltransferase